jgi:hypothetical protein
MPAFFQFVFLLLGLLGAHRTGGLLFTVPPNNHDPPEEARAGEGEMTSHQEQILLAQSDDGYERREIHGQRCAEGHTRGFTAAMMSGSGLCMVEGWASDDPEDCRVLVHLRQAPAQSGLCVVTVYETPL